MSVDLKHRGCRSSGLRSASAAVIDSTSRQVERSHSSAKCLSHHAPQERGCITCRFDLLSSVRLEGQGLEFLAQLAEPFSEVETVFPSSATPT